MSDRKTPKRDGTNVRLSPETHAMAKDFAERCSPKSTIVNVVEAALNEYLHRYEAAQVKEVDAPKSQRSEGGGEEVSEQRKTA